MMPKNTLDAPIGIFGGTFDPLHLGHMQLALSVYKELQLQQMRFIPCAQPLLRDVPIASAEQRLAMLRLAVQDYPYFVIDDCEIMRGGPSYTVDTLTALRAEQPNTPLCFLMSSDQFSQFDQWRDWQCIPELAHIIVNNRAGYPLTLSPAVKAMLQAHQTQDAEDMHETLAGRIILHSFTMSPISGTDIRARLQQGKRIEDLVPEKVWEYIQHQGLYQPADKP